MPIYPILELVLIRQFLSFDDTSFSRLSLRKLFSILRLSTFRIDMASLDSGWTYDKTKGAPVQI